MTFWVKYSPLMISTTPPLSCFSFLRTVQSFPALLLYHKTRRRTIPSSTKRCTSRICRYICSPLHPADCFSTIVFYNGTPRAGDKKEHLLFRRCPIEHTKLDLVTPTQPLLLKFELSPSSLKTEVQLRNRHKLPYPVSV